MDPRKTWIINVYVNLTPAQIRLSEYGRPRHVNSQPIIEFNLFIQPRTSRGGVYPSVPKKILRTNHANKEERARKGEELISPIINIFFICKKKR